MIGSPENINCTPNQCCTQEQLFSKPDPSMGVSTCGWHVSGQAAFVSNMFETQSQPWGLPAIYDETSSVLIFLDYDVGI
jgi:hypothetical protein